MAGSDLEGLKSDLRAFAKARDWQQFHSPKNLATALIVEAAELVEHFQWLTEEQSRTLPESVQDEVALEMADMLIYLVRLADQLGVDLVESARHKMAMNERRYPVELSKGRAGRPVQD